MASATTAGFTPINSHGQVMYVDIISTTTSTTTITTSARAKQPRFSNLFQEPVQKSQVVTITKQIIGSNDEDIVSSNNNTPRTTVVPTAGPDAPDTTAAAAAAAAAAAITRKSCLKKNYAIERRLVTAPRKFTTASQAKTNSDDDDDDSSNHSDSDNSDDESDANYKYVQVRPPGYIDPKKRSRMAAPPGQMLVVRKVSFNEELNETRLFCHDRVSAVESVDNNED